MKKRLLAIALCATAVLSLGACGKKNNIDTQDTEVTEVFGTEADTQVIAHEGPYSVQMEIDAQKCVKKLCDYKNIEISLTGDYAVTDEDVEGVLNNLLSQVGLTTIKVNDRNIVKEGDYVLVDYTGYKDGVAFDGGAATDVMIDPANNMSTDGMGYIEGFSDDLIGAKVGTTIESDVTFPEEYDSEELAGQAVVFEFNIKEIHTPITKDNLTDEMVATFFSEQYSVSTKQDLLDFIETYLTTQQTTYFVEDYVLANSEVEVPEDYLNARLEEYVESYALNYYGSMETMEYYMTMYGTTLDEVKETWKAQMEASISVELIFEAIALKEGISVEAEKFDEYVATNFVDETVSGYENAEAVYNSLGFDDTAAGKRYLERLYLMNNAMEFVIDNAK